MLTFSGQTKHLELEVSKSKNKMRDTLGQINGLKNERKSLAKKIGK